MNAWGLSTLDLWAISVDGDDGDDDDDDDDDDHKNKNRNVRSGDLSFA